jgi:hypothetical protein
MARIGQHADRQHCHWFESRHCKVCGYTVEIDGDEHTIEPDIRQTILEQEGEWTLLIPNKRSDVLQIAKVLRHLFGLSVAETQLIIRPQQNAFIAGTRAEMAWLAQQLAHQGIQSDSIEGASEPLVRLTVTPQHHYGITVTGVSRTTKPGV